MKSKPCSILTATKQRLEFLKEAYDSLKKQSFANWEWIVINDGADSKTHRWLYELAKVESRLIFQSVYPIGPPNALARALSYAQGEWVGFLDDDDYLAFDCLEKCIQAVEGLKIGMLYTSYFEDRNNSYSPGPKNRMPYPEGRLFLNALPFHFKFINREALLKIGGINSSFLFAWDYDMCLRLSEVAEIHHLPIPLYYYRIHPEQLSQSKLIDQVYYTYQAIEASLRRRGLDKKFRLTIEPTYRLENIL